MSLMEKFEEFRRLVKEAERLFGELSAELKRIMNEQTLNFRVIAEQLGFLNFDEGLFKSFLRRPYVVLPRREGEWYLVVPRFVDLQFGWLYRQTESFNVFLVNRYIDWIYSLPEEIRRELGFKEPPFKLAVEGDYLVCRPEDADLVWKRYRKFLLRREAPGKIRIKRRSHFLLICQLIKDGILPFKPKPVDPRDLLDRYPKFELRDYQLEAWNKFLKLGCIGVYWPPGAGKMFFSLYALTRIKGRKLVVVPTVTLKEEWERKIKQLTPLRPDEYEVICYASAHKALRKEWTLTIFDEHQHLPANSYVKLASIKTKYRIGTTATPWREDGRIELIFALTGFPVGLSWKQFLERGIITKPVIEVIIVKNLTEKFEVLDELLQLHHDKTIIFCDSIKLGKRISRKHGVPFVYGAISKRLEIIEKSPVAVVSRVGDEGIDITNLKTVIEFDFLYGSRRQEAQRLGRLLHSRFKGRHFILMTEEEFTKYKKRLYGIYEKGFQIKIKRR